MGLVIEVSPFLTHSISKDPLLIFFNSIIQYLISLSQVDSADIPEKGNTVIHIRHLNLNLKAHVDSSSKHRICN